MTELTYIIKDVHGIHARPAGELVREIQKYTCDVKITKNPKTVDGKRLFAVMGLGAKQSDTLHITCDGEDETEAAQAISAFLSENL